MAIDEQYAAELEAGISAVREAAGLCREVQAQITPDVLEKRDRSPVTLADFGSQALVCRVIGDRFPDDPIIAEEDSAALGEPENRPLLERLTAQVGKTIPGADSPSVRGWIDRGGASDYSGRFWTLDPIDGTKGFLRGQQYAISLALIVDGEIRVAVLGCPNLGTTGVDSGGQGSILFAVRGAGAFQQPLDEDVQPARVTVSSQTDATGLRFCESVERAHSSHDDSARLAERLGIRAAPVRLDSQTKYAVVARGEAEAYLRLPRTAEYREKIWDHAGGVLVVTEAGGRVTDIRGRELAFNHGRTLAENLGVIVSNGALHEPILNAIEALGIGVFSD